MCTPVGRKDLVVEVFDTQAQTCHTDLFHRLQLRFLNRARFTLKRDFLRVLPTDMLVQTIDEITQLLLTDVRRCAAAEVCKTKLPSLKSGHAAVELILFDESVEVDLDLRSVLVCINFEVTEQAALPAKRNVNVET